MAAAPPTLTLDALNAMPRDAFVAALGEVFEYSPWVAESAHAARPFASVTALHDVMMAAVRTKSSDEQLELIRAHPELGSKVGRACLTADSQSEQGSLGLDRLSDSEFSRFEALNTAYRKRFGFPFIICVRRHTRDSILHEFERRLRHDPAVERAACIDEIARITRLRIAARVSGPGMPKTEGRLSTHVLDQSAGRPLAGVAIVLFEIGASARGQIATAITNADGRTDKPLIGGEPLRIGQYELEFDIGRAFAGAPAFFNKIPLRFSIGEPESHYHIPLLVTPWSYTTYRGS